MDNKSYLQIPEWESVEDRLRGSSQCVCDDNCNDKYTAAIELSNRCREFYRSRLEAANSIRSRWLEDSAARCRDSDVDSGVSCSPSSSSPPSLSSPSLSSEINDNDKTSKSKQQRQRIDTAMEKLRSELVSLMDQDLSLMKQLLTLNETIEELKWQRQHYNSSSSWASFSASRNMDSNCSVSDTQMYESEEEEEDFGSAHHASFSSLQTRHVTGSTWLSSRNARKTFRDFQKISVQSENSLEENAVPPVSSMSITVPCTRINLPVKDSNLASTTDQRFTADHHLIASGPIIVHHEREQNSFDSGIHESTSGDELTWSS